MHNKPGLAVGEFAICEGAITASTDEFTITINGTGAHAALPHRGIDPIVISAQLINALQTIVSRNSNPLDSLVISVTQIHAGNTYNVIPESAVLNGTIRALNKQSREFAEKRLRDITKHIVEASGATADIDFRIGYPVTINHAEQTNKAAQVASRIAGESKVNANSDPMMWGEDFSYMLEERPGAYIFMGNGDSAGLHNPAYDFNDEAIPHGSSFWAQLVETISPAA